MLFSRSTNWLTFLTVLAVVGFAGYKVYSYITHKGIPTITIAGLQSEGTYKGLYECALQGKNDYKVKSAEMLIDGHPVKTPFGTKISAKSFDKKFTIDTIALGDGKHTFELTVTDASYNANKNNYSFIFYVDNQPLTATMNNNDYVVDQGKTVRPIIHVNKKLKRATIKAFGKTFDCCEKSPTSNDYECFIPVEIEQTPEQSLLIAELEDLAGNKITLQSSVTVKVFNFVKQKGFAVSSEKLEEEREISMGQNILQDAITQWVEKSPRYKLWFGSFELPLEVKRIVTPHGEIRMTPVRGRYFHKGVDLTNLPRCVVWASQTGIIIIKDRYEITGNTLVIDHGMGVFTMYAHLEDFANIEVGQTIKKGNPIGRMGKTGYASGYHLHWEILVCGVSVEPLEWTKISY